MTRSVWSTRRAASPIAVVVTRRCASGSQACESAPCCETTTSGPKTAASDGTSARTAASHASSPAYGAPSWFDLAVGMVLTAIPLVLIAKEPDLGTAVTLLPVFFAIAYLAGMRMRIFGLLFLCLLLAAPVAWKFALKDYQKSRVSTFLDPSQDAKGAGYQQIQARITVGSGGLTGKGFKKGTQGQLRFLPVAHNDFIFSVLAEEQGFAGVLVALGLYLFVILRALEAARLANCQSNMKQIDLRRRQDRQEVNRRPRRRKFMACVTSGAGSCHRPRSFHSPDDGWSWVLFVPDRSMP